VDGRLVSVFGRHGDGACFGSDSLRTMSGSEWWMGVVCVLVGGTALVSDPVSRKIRRMLPLRVFGRDVEVPVLDRPASVRRQDRRAGWASCECFWAQLRWSLFWIEQPLNGVRIGEVDGRLVSVFGRNCDGV
jgi:hypothetical protein